MALSDLHAIPGLRVWNPSAGTETTSGGGTPAVADGDPLGRWTSGDGGAAVLRQADAGKRLAVGRRGPGGVSRYVRTGGDDDFLEAEDSAIAAARVGMTMTAAVRLADYDNDNAPIGVVQFGPFDIAFFSGGNWQISEAGVRALASFNAEFKLSLGFWHVITVTGTFGGGGTTFSGKVYADGTEFATITNEAVNAVNGTLRVFDSSNPSGSANAGIETPPGTEAGPLCFAPARELTTEEREQVETEVTGYLLGAYPLADIDAPDLTFGLLDTRDWILPVSEIDRKRQNLVAMTVTTREGAAPAVDLAAKTVARSGGAAYAARLDSSQDTYKCASLAADLSLSTLPTDDFVVGVGHAKGAAGTGDGVWVCYGKTAGVASVFVRTLLAGVVRDTEIFAPGGTGWENNGVPPAIGDPLGVVAAQGMSTLAGFLRYTEVQAGMEGGLNWLTGLDLRPLVTFYLDADLTQIRQSLWVEQGAGGTGSFAFGATVWGYKGVLKAREFWALCYPDGEQVKAFGREMWVLDTAVPRPTNLFPGQYQADPRWAGTHQAIVSLPEDPTDLSGLREETLVFGRWNGISRCVQDHKFTVSVSLRALVGVGPMFCVLNEDQAARAALGLSSDSVPLMRSQTTDGADQFSLLFSGERTTNPDRVLVLEHEIFTAFYDATGTTPGAFEYDADWVGLLGVVHRNPADGGSFGPYLLPVNETYSAFGAPTCTPAQFQTLNGLADAEGGRLVRVGNRTRFVTAVKESVANNGGRKWAVCDAATGEQVGSLTVPASQVGGDGGYPQHPGWTSRRAGASNTSYGLATFDANADLGFGVGYAETCGRLYLLRALEQASGAQYAWRTALAAYPAESDPVATPVISPAPGSILTTAPVSVTCETAGADIRYTLDGSTPDETSTLYAAPFTLAAGNRTVKAIGIKAGQPDSAVASAAYTVTAPDTTAPALSSRVLASDGLALTLVTSEATTGTAGFTVRVAGIIRGHTAARTDGTTVVLTLASPAYAGEAVTVSYDQTAGNVLDAAGNELAAVASAAVTNNSAQAAPDGGGGGTYLPGEIEIEFELVPSCRDLMADGDEPVQVVVTLKDGRFYLPQEDFTYEMAFAASSAAERIWREAALNADGEASLTVTGSADEPLAAGTYLLFVRVKSAGVVLQSAQVGVITVR